MLKKSFRNIDIDLSTLYIIQRILLKEYQRSLSNMAHYFCFTFLLIFAFTKNVIISFIIKHTYKFVTRKMGILAAASSSWCCFKMVVNYSCMWHEEDTRCRELKNQLSGKPKCKKKVF